MLAIASYQQWFGCVCVLVLERRWGKSSQLEKKFGVKAPEINTAGTDIYSGGEGGQVPSREGAPTRIAGTLEEREARHQRERECQ